MSLRKVVSLMVYKFFTMTLLGKTKNHELLLFYEENDNLYDERIGIIFQTRRVHVLHFIRSPHIAIQPIEFRIILLLLH